MRRRKIESLSRGTVGPAAVLVGVEGEDWEDIVLQTDPSILEADSETPKRKDDISG